SYLSLFSSPLPPPPRSTLFPYTTLFRSIRSRKLAIIIPTLLALGLAAAYVFAVQKPQYTAQAKVLVNPIVTPSTTNGTAKGGTRSEEHTSELQSRSDLVCRLLLEKKKKH